jgi:hypothetical protein
MEKSMPLASQQKPTVGYLVDITLASGGLLQGYWDGLQWWCGVDGQPDDVPITNQYVISWNLVQ